MTLNELATTYYNLVRFSVSVEDESRRESLEIAAGEILLSVVQGDHSTFDFFAIVDELRRLESETETPKTEEYMVVIVHEEEYFVILDATSEEDAIEQANHGILYDPHFMDNAEEAGRHTLKVKDSEIA